MATLSDDRLQAKREALLNCAAEHLAEWFLERAGEDIPEAEVAAMEAELLAALDSCAHDWDASGEPTP